MAQGKLKVKSKVPANVAKKNKQKQKAAALKQKQQVKGGFGKIQKPKKAGDLVAAKFNKKVQKAINSSIESELAARAQRVEEGKTFLTLGDPSTSGKSKKK